MADGLKMEKTGLSAGQEIPVRGGGLPADFATRVIAWQRRHGRHDLPWQQTRDAYRVWLSEIMLQQTQVTSVLAYYDRFLMHFPTVEVLAAASLDAVMAQWSGLGYYSRARNLHRCAQQIVEQYGGVFPSDPDQLVALAGIGRSTAAAVTAFAYGTRAAILDGNVKRVFARVFGVDGYPGEKRVETEMWRMAEALLPQQGIETYTQGLMDLGATLCTRGRPQCLQDAFRCPLSTQCVAYREGRTGELPVAKPRKALPIRHVRMLLLQSEQGVLLERRPESGVWGGLWSLPEQPWCGTGHQPEREAIAIDVASITAQGELAELQTLDVVEHIFTHFKLRIQPVHIVLKGGQTSTHASRVWLPLGRAMQQGLPAPVRKLLDNLSMGSGSGQLF